MMTAAPHSSLDNPPWRRGVPGRTDAAAWPLSFHTLEDTIFKRSSASSRTVCSTPIESHAMSTACSWKLQNCALTAPYLDVHVYKLSTSAPVESGKL